MAITAINGVTYSGVSAVNAVAKASISAIMGVTAGGGGGGGATLVQSTHEYPSDGILAYGSNNTAGNLLIAVFSGHDHITTPTMTDTQLNTWAEAITVDSISNNNCSQSIFYAMNCAAGANIVTVAAGFPGDDGSLTLYEFSGCLTSGALRTTASQLGTVQGSTTTPTTTAFTAGAADLLFYGYSNESDDATFAAGTGFTAGELDHGQTFFTQYNLSATVGSQTAFMTLGTARGQWVITLCALRTL